MSNPDLQYWVDELAATAKAAVRWVIHLDRHRATMPSGHNGPYFDIEGPVRNTAHWLVTFSVVHKLTGIERYREIGLQLARFLLEPGAYLGSGVYVHRQKAGKDSCNGVIGQAWLVEGLRRAGDLLGDSDCAKLAVTLAERLPFDHTVGAWRRVSPNGKVLSVDYTYNHQAWFAAAKAEVHGTQSREIVFFLDRSLLGGFRTRASGLVVHILHANSIRSRITDARYRVWRHRAPSGARTKEVGYHLYVLYALARLHSAFPQHAFFQCAAFQSALELAFSPDFQQELIENPYAYPYNAPGFEMLRIADEFSEAMPSGAVLARRVYERQKDRTFAPEVGLHIRGAPDPFTLAARVYELALGVEAMAEKRTREAPKGLERKSTVVS